MFLFGFILGLAIGVSALVGYILYRAKIAAEALKVAGKV